MTTLGEHVAIETPFTGLSIAASDSATAGGGTPAENHWTAMTNHGKFTAYVKFKSRAEGYISEILVQQATGSNGANLKALTGGTYTLAATAIDATGEDAIIEVDANQLDVANGFDHLRIKVTHTGGTNTNSVDCVYVKSQPRFSKIDWATYTLRLPQDQAGT